MVRRLVATGFFDIVGYAEGYGDIWRALHTGDAHVALVVPVRYAADIEAGRTTRLQLVVDGTDPQVVSSATGTAAAVISNVAGVVQLARLDRLGLRHPDEAITLEPNILYNPNLRTAVYIVPGLIGVILTMTMVMLTAMAMARERGTLEQLIVSPVRKLELMVGKIVPYVAIGYLQMAIILALGRYVFDVPCAGSVPLLFALSFVFIAANLAIGLLFSTVAKTQQQAMQMSFFFLLPNILLSGFMFPFESMPRPARWLSQALPLTHFMRIVRGIVLKDSHLRELRGELAWLAATLVVLVLVSSLRFRKKLL